jgi:hypothetical protein
VRRPGTASGLAAAGSRPLSARVGGGAMAPLDTGTVGWLWCKNRVAAPEWHRCHVQNEFQYLGIPFSYATPNPIASLKHGHHSKANAVMHAVLHRCREMCIHDVRIRCKLFRSVVAPVLAYGCEVWGAYALASIGTQACAWGAGGALLGESVHKAFLRGTQQVRQSAWPDSDSDDE